MPKSTKSKSPDPVIVRNSRGEFYKLASGRLIPVPPRGGNVSRREIRAAVQAAVAGRKSAKIG